MGQDKCEYLFKGKENYDHNLCCKITYANCGKKDTTKIFHFGQNRIFYIT
jgi:hypothetical protein